MDETAQTRASAAGLITAENRQSPDIGTPLANYSTTPSCALAKPDDGQRGTWGGARNRADRVSHGLTDAQVWKLVTAAQTAFETGRIFQRHWTVHYGLAGIQPSDGARFVGKLLDLIGKQARRDGGKVTAIWVRECASGKGEHVHILLHLPAGMSLRNRTRRWIVAAGGTYRAGVSKVTVIGGRLSKVERNRERPTAEIGDNSKGHAAQNAENVVRYILKAGARETGARLGLLRSGEGGAIIGKRCGWTQNVSENCMGQSMSAYGFCA